MTGQATPAGAAAPDLDGAVTALLHVAKAAVEAAQWAKGGQAAEAAWLLGNQLRGHLADAAEALGLTAVRGEGEGLAVVRAEDVTDEDVEAGYEAAVDMGGDETLSGWEAVRAVLQTDRARVAARLAARHAAAADGVVEAEIVCGEDRCGHAIESHGDGGCMVLGCAVPPYGGPCEATYVEMVAPSVLRPTLIADPSTLPGRARLVADLLDQIGGSGVSSLDIGSGERFFNTYRQRVETEAKLCVRSLDDVRAIAEVLGGSVETAPWERGKPGSLRHAVSAEWRGLQVEAYAIVEPASQSETGAGQ